MSSRSSDSGGFSLFVGGLLCLAFLGGGVVLFGRNEAISAVLYLLAAAFLAALLIWGRDDAMAASGTLAANGTSSTAKRVSYFASTAAAEPKVDEPVEELPPSEDPVAEDPVDVEPIVAESVADRAKPLTAAALPDEGAADDDLKKIEGIGPKIAGLLKEDGIRTFAQLAAAEVTRLQDVLDRAGSRYKLANPETWPEQAGCAAAGRWEDLGTLQDQLKGGRRA